VFFRRDGVFVIVHTPCLARAGDRSKMGEMSAYKSFPTNPFSLMPLYFKRLRIALRSRTSSLHEMSCTGRSLIPGSPLILQPRK
jgi:hypothetical protein